jgi:hypothetical protein
MLVQDLLRAVAFRQCVGLGGVSVDRESAATAAQGLDPLVARVLTSYPYRFTLPDTPDQRGVAYRIRGAVVAGLGWTEERGPDGQEIDEFDDAAVQVLGWVDGVAVSTGRLVLPPGPLPTEQACGLVVQPPGQVVDIGRMAVVPSYQSYRHAAFIALLCRLYLEMRERGYSVACGMMAPRARGLVKLLGLSVEVLAPDRPYWHEDRAPVRFELLRSAPSLTDRWDD